MLCPLKFHLRYFFHKKLRQTYRISHKSLEFICLIIGMACLTWFTKKYTPYVGGSGIPQVIASINLPHSSYKTKLVEFSQTIWKIPLTFLAMLIGVSVGRISYWFYSCRDSRKQPLFSMLSRGNIGFLSLSLACNLWGGLWHSRWHIWTIISKRYRRIITWKMAWLGSPTSYLYCFIIGFSACRTVGVEMTGAQLVLVWLLISSIIASIISRHFSPKPFYHFAAGRFRQQMQARQAEELRSKTKQEK